MHPRSPEAHSVFGTGALLLCQPSEMVRVARRIPRNSATPAFSILPSAFEVVARVGLAPTPCGLTNRRATLTPPGNGAAGRSSTCIVPFRRRMPHVFGHDSNSNWSERQDFHLRPPGPKPGALKTELRSEKMADPKGVAPSTLPQTTGRSCELSYESKMVGSAGNAPVRLLPFYFSDT